MESVLNRLRDTVSATVYQVTSNLSTALPGNPLTREYELVRQVGSSGPNLLFKIYEAYKKNTKENASLFILEKKSLDKFSKKEKEYFLDIIRRGVPQLTRLRHPSMLTVQHNLEESRDLIAFVTEPVIGSLANFINPNADEKDKFEFYDVEIKYGLLQIAEGLLFLHKDAKIVHRNLCPENIVINRNGIWKISGFEFCVQPISINENPFKFIPIKIIPDISLDIQANFTYTAPENFENVSYIDVSSDIFSLGMITHTLYNKGKPMLPFSSTYQFRPDRFSAELRDKLDSSSTLSVIPEDCRKHVKLLLSVDTSLRPDAHQISKLQIFQDVLVRTLQYFDSMFQWDNAQKAQFYKNLPEILVKFPKRVKLRRIVSGLAKEFVNPEMVPFVLPNMIEIAKETTDEEFHTWIVPDLIPVFKYKEPIQIGIFLLQNMDFLVKKFTSKPDSLREHIISLIYRFLESEAYQIQELCLSVTPTVIHLIDYTGSKNMLLPRIKKLALNTKLLSVRVNCLVCLGKILEHLDKWLVIDQVLTMVMQMPSREPAVIMASVGIFKLALNSNKLGITKEILATKIVPFLVPLSIENGLTLSQYNTVMGLIREILNKIEEEHQLKLQQLDSIKVQQNSFFNNTETNNSNDKSSKASFDLFSSDNSENISLNDQTKKLNSLSLDEKERLSFEREQSNRLNKEKPLLPEPKQASTAISSQSKDLTSTLIGYNLNLMSKTSPSSQISPSFNSLNSSSIYKNPSNQTFNNSLVKGTQPTVSLAAFDNLNIPDLNNKKSNPQTLNYLKNNTISTTNINQSPAINANYNLSNFSTFGPKDMTTKNLINGYATSSQPSKQLSKSELEEFLN